ncbi:hypothetical protein EVAR_87553_1 [Eumeta japonica]|uniref:Uncharacterized protein n=1 Tax=Eumeta variegata TaxID=151549 RepID=A0A4C1XTR0_EUMVA|nr:hypothetical protein EVAR_87553_1 [Eumeta japonica]
MSAERDASARIQSAGASTNHRNHCYIGAGASRRSSRSNERQTSAVTGSTFLQPPDGPTAATYLFLLQSHTPSNHAGLYIPVPASIAPDPAHVCAALASPPRRSYYQFSSATPGCHCRPNRRGDQDPSMDGQARHTYLFSN